MSSDNEETLSSIQIEEETKKKKKLKKNKNKRKLENASEPPSMPKKKVKKIQEETSNEIDEEKDNVEMTGKKRSFRCSSMKFRLGSVTNSGGHLTSTTFDSLSERGVSDSTIKALKEMKLTTMTEIQAKTIGPLLEGRSVELFSRII